MTPIQHTVRAILENADMFDWSLQGLGMLRLYLPGDARLHIWNHDFAFPGASPVHDHLQWGLTSTIVSGEIANQRFKELPTGHYINNTEWQPYHWARFIAGYDAKMLHEPETMLLKRLPVEHYTPGMSYSQEPNEVHQTIAKPGTVTIMQKRPTEDGATARIFWPEGTQWGSAKPRAATPAEVEAITRQALLVFPT